MAKTKVDEKAEDKGVLVTDIDANQVVAEGFKDGQRDGTSVEQGPIPRLNDEAAHALKSEREKEKEEADLRYAYKIEQLAEEKKDA